MILMIPPLSSAKGKRIRRLVAGCCVMGAVVSGCAKASDPLATHDPIEPFNRSMHEVNRAIDKAVLRPLSTSTKGNGAVAERVGDFADNLGKPADIVNNVLQLRLVKAAENTLRFSFNSVFGLAGLFDVATEAGMPENKTDFGETLHIWGFGEGAYLELPLLGPSTGRDFVGEIVDVFIDPLNALPEPDKYLATAAKVASKIGDRGRYSETVDSVLYDSADSYAQARLLYLQNRRYELGQTAGEDSFVDPYEDPYAE